MAKNFLVGIDLGGRQLRNAALQNLTTHPVGKNSGFVYFNSVDNTVYVYTGSTWIDLGESNLSLGTNDGNTLVILNDAGVGVTLPAATGSSAGLMTSAMWTKLNNILGTNTGDQTISLSGDVTTANMTNGSYTATINNNVVTLAKLQQIATGYILGRTSAGSGNVELLNLATLKSSIGLGNVENVAVSTWLGSTNITTLGTITTGIWNGTAIPMSKGGTGNTSFTGNTVIVANSDGTSLISSTIPVSKLNYLANVTGDIQSQINGLLASNDAMVFKGTVGTGGTYSSSAFNALDTYEAGWTFKVTETTTIKGKVCENGDLIIATVDRTSGGLNTDWVVIQSNIDGAVVGPTSSVDNNIVVFSGTSGKIIKDSTITISSLIKKIIGTITGADTSFSINHGLGVNVIVQVRSAVNSEIIECDVVTSNVNSGTTTISFEEAPGSNIYSYVILG